MLASPGKDHKDRCEKIWTCLVWVYIAECYDICTLLIAETPRGEIGGKASPVTVRQGDRQTGSGSLYSV